MEKFREGSPCNICGKTLRYIKGGACVNCSRLRAKHQAMPKRKGVWKHKLTQINETTLRAICQFCGPIKVKRKRKGFVCINKVNEERKKYRERHKERLNLAARLAYKEAPKVKADPADTRRKMLWADYRLTPEDYQFLLEKQNGVCAICLQPSSDDRSLAVDHCHTTGKVRGLLCMRHNLLLGFAQDDPQILTAAIQYLKSHS